MSVLRIIIIGAAVSFVAIACSNEGDDAEPGAASESEAAASTETQHAPEGAEPGSHADWCGEHAVPESQCTRCNPDLVAAFKATDDWCDEHGLPESQCTKCNPDLEIVRPPPPESAEE